MKHESESPEPPVPNPAPPVVARHDGWTGEKMARFCEMLAETAVVAEACDEAGMGVSGAYAFRRRNPVFAAAWDAALTIARERLADTLLARSMEGNVEQIYKDGELVGERHVLDNRLGLAILRRLDRLAETGATVSSRGERFTLHPVRPDCPEPSRGERSRGGPVILPCRQGFDWEAAITALRTGDDEGVAKALAMLKGDEVEEVEDPPVSLTQDPEDDAFDLSDRCWMEDVWMTDFPPPAGFTGYESRPYDEDDGEAYERACTAEEVSILEADAAAGRAAERGEEEELRDSWFEYLKGELTAPPLPLGSHEGSAVVARSREK